MRLPALIRATRRLWKDRPWVLMWSSLVLVLSLVFGGSFVSRQISSRMNAGEIRYPEMFGPFGPLSCGESALYHFRGEHSLDDSRASAKAWLSQRERERQRIFKVKPRRISASHGLAIEGNAFEGRLLVRPAVLSTARRLYVFDFILGGQKRSVRALFGRDGRVQALFTDRTLSSTEHNAVVQVVDRFQLDPRLPALAWGKLSRRGGHSAERVLELRENGPTGTELNRYRRIGGVSSKDTRQRLQKSTEAYVAAFNLEGDNFLASPRRFPQKRSSLATIVLGSGGIIQSISEHERFDFPLTIVRKGKGSPVVQRGESDFELTRLTPDPDAEELYAETRPCVAVRGEAESEFQGALVSGSSVDIPFRVKWATNSGQALVARMRERVMDEFPPSVLMKMIRRDQQKYRRGGSDPQLGVDDFWVEMAIQKAGSDNEAVAAFGKALGVALNGNHPRVAAFWARVLALSEKGYAQEKILEVGDARAWGAGSEPLLAALRYAPTMPSGTLDRLVSLASDSRLDVKVRTEAMYAAAAGARISAEDTRARQLMAQWNGLLAGESDPAWQGIYIESIGRLGLSDGFEILKDWSEKRLPHVSENAIRAMAFVEGTRVDRYLLALWRDEGLTAERSAAEKALQWRMFGDSGVQERADRAIDLSREERERLAEARKTAPVFAGRAVL
jgi:hypothetical protein